MVSAMFSMYVGSVVNLARTEEASGLVRDTSVLIRNASGLVREASGLVRDASGLVRGNNGSRSFLLIIIHLNLPQVSHNKTMSVVHNFVATVNYLYSIINNCVNKKITSF